MIKVKSSSVDSADYVWGRIIVKFKTWLMYEYKAPRDVYEKFLKSESKGNFAKTILWKSFSYKKIK